MKRNLILLFICLCLGGYAYYSQEYLPTLGEKEQELPHFDYGNLKEISTDHVTLEVHEHFEMIKGKLVPSDPFVSRQVLELINNLRVEKAMTREEVDRLGVSKFFPESDFIHLRFDSTDLKLYIGKKVSYSRSFYGAIEHNKKKSYYILKDKRPLLGMYDEEQYRKSDEHYLKIVGLLHLDEKFFIPQSQAIFMKGIKAIAIKTNRSKAFRIDLENKNIIPKVFAEAKIDEKEIQEFLNRLAKIKMKRGKFISTKLREDVFVNAFQFEKLIGEIQFHFTNDQFISVKAFQGRDVKEMVLYNSRWDFSQTYRLSDFKFLFPHHQDFYIKKPFKGSEAIVELNHEGKSDRDIQQLGSFLAKGADWLSKIDKIDSQLLIDKITDFKVGSKVFRLFKQNNDLVLVDDKEKIKYHYYRGMISLNKNQ